jgi:hypothetical protein
MKRLFLILAAFALLVAACSGSTVDEKANAVAPDDGAGSIASSSVPEESSPDSSAPTSSNPETLTSAAGTKPPPPGPAARDFTLALEPSGEFVLSAEAKPVYMIFWAEW